MIKREAGYDEANGDWEYTKAPFHSAVDYTAHPFGLLPDETDTENRGAIVSCLDCHAMASGGDYLFVND